MQRLRHAVDLGGDRRDRRPARGMLAFVIQTIRAARARTWEENLSAIFLGMAPLLRSWRLRSTRSSSVGHICSTNNAAERLRGEARQKVMAICGIGALSTAGRSHLHAQPDRASSTTLIRGFGCRGPRPYRGPSPNPGPCRCRRSGFLMANGKAL
jgi:hypothetical protein